MLSSVVSSSLLFLLNESRFEPRLWLATEGLVDLKDIKAIIDLMKKNSISEFELERQDFKIRLKRGGMALSLSLKMLQRLRFCPFRPQAQRGRRWPSCPPLRR